MKKTIKLWIAIISCSLIVLCSCVFASNTSQIQPITIEESNNEVEGQAVEQEKQGEYVNPYPTIVIKSFEAKRGKTIEVPVIIKASNYNYVTSGGIKLSYNNKLKYEEFVSGSTYMTEVNNDKDNGIIVIAFSTREVKENETIICTLKFKVPNDYNEDEIKIALLEVESLYNNDFTVPYYFNEDVTVKLDKSVQENNFNMNIIYIVIGGVAVLMILITVVILMKKKK